MLRKMVNISSYLQAAGAYRVAGLPESTSSGFRQLYTNALALYALQIPGDFVETGVFKGATSIAMMRILKANDAKKRHYACDSFVGLPDPVPGDRRCQFSKGATVRSCVQGAAGSFGAPREAFEKSVHQERLMHFLTVVPGWFNESLPPQGVRQISFLRLDGDMYESTRWPLLTLYPLVAPGGVIYIDDYGSYAGCAAAVNEYFREHGLGQPEEVLQPIVEFGGSKLNIESVWFQKPFTPTEANAPEPLLGAAPCWKHGAASCQPGGPMDAQMRLAASVCADARQRDGYNAEHYNRTGRLPPPWQCPPMGRYKRET